MVMTPEPELADVLIINTCSFIDQAKMESINAIHEAVDDREVSRPRQKIIVAGCLSQRFSKELPGLMPEVDAFIGLDQITQVAPVIRDLVGKDEDPHSENFVTASPQYIPDYDTPRFRLTPKHSAYIKIAEGCNHPCSFCIIPKIRGKHRSRTLESVVKEAEALVKSGVKEINLISQDTTYFGMDRWEGQRPNPRSGVDSSRGDSLASLLRALNAIEGDFWIRLLYTHPAHWSDELIQAIAECPKVARYVDMPLQHISDRMLGMMKRETDGAYIRDLVRRMREGIPGLALRTTFIVGFPGETDTDFAKLMQLIEELQFDNSFSFIFSPRPGTPAANLADDTPHTVKLERLHKVQAAINTSISRISESLEDVKTALALAMARLDELEKADKPAEVTPEPTPEPEPEPEAEPVESKPAKKAAKTAEAEATETEV